jgi:peptide/nickel transport system permease protein
MALIESQVRAYHVGSDTPLRPEPATPDTASGDSRLRGALGRAFRRPGFLLAVTYVLLVLVSALLPSLFAGYGANAVAPTDKLLGPSFAHLFGTDELGRDLFSRVIYGSRASIAGMGLAVGLAAVLGLVIGIASGFFGGALDALLMRGVDVLLAIPSLLLALAIVTALGFGTVKVAVAVGAAILPGFARMTRAEVLKVKTLPYVEAARSSGAGWGRVLIRHILPNSWGPVVVLVVLDLGTAILAISALSFLGFGAQPPAADWGALISDGRGYLVTSPWLSLFPGFFVGFLVLSLNHIGKTMEELQR